MNKLNVKELYRQENNVVIIDIDILSYRDIYNHWDFSPELKRGLDRDLIEYLKECCEEIPIEYSIEINIHMPKEKYNAENEAINRKCFYKFLKYKIEKLQLKKRTMYHNAFKYTSFGLVFLITVILIRDRVLTNTLLTLLKEALFIGAWVLIWELFTTIFIWNGKNKKTIETLNRLSEVAIAYKYK